MATSDWGERVTRREPGPFAHVGVRIAREQPGQHLPIRQEAALPDVPVDNALQGGPPEVTLS
jgi:hypothetical protein